MDVYVRLYWQHDLDLIALHYSPSLPKIGYLLKESLTAHVRGTPFEVLVPEKIMFQKPIKSCNANIKLYEGRDDDLIAYVKSLHYGLRSNAVKQILRGYLNHMFMLPYAQGSGVAFKTKIHSNKKSNQYVADKRALEVEKRKEESPQVSNPAPPDPEPVSKPVPKVTPVSKTESIPKPDPVPESASSPPEEPEGEFDLFDSIDAML